VDRHLVARAVAQDEGDEFDRHPGSDAVEGSPEVNLSDYIVKTPSREAATPQSHPMRRRPHARALLSRGPSRQPLYALLDFKSVTPDQATTKREIPLKISYSI
jgi:hypothetical protein